LRTLFAPWHRYRISYGRGFDLKVWAEAFFSNLIFRVLGAIVRIAVISFGVLFEVFIFLIGLAIFLGWLILPFVLLFGFLFAIKLLFY
jgi:cellulose synthase/poly-beta-1,6-N-acetylglucosamine synthase-like glycosyltransferase